MARTFNGPIIGIAGTAKNTGKTTTFNAVTRYLRRIGRDRLLTSIGYDGEDLDSITGLPKPKVFVETGDVVATALPLLRASTAVFDEPALTGVECALGPVCVAKVRDGGKVVLAGPTSTKDVETVLGFVSAALPSRDRITLLDGAFSRMSPMALSTHLLIATGAARYQFPGFISQNMDELAAVFGLPLDEGEWDLVLDHGLFDDEGAELVFEAIESVWKDQAFQGAAQVTALAAADAARMDSPGIVLRCAINGVVAPSPLTRLLELLDKSPRNIRVTFGFAHPISLLLSGDLSLWRGTIQNAARAGHNLAVRATSRLLGFTISPYFPVYDMERREYVASYASPRSFLNEIRSRTSVPCTDIILEGTRILESWIDSVSVTKESPTGA
ncbi:MAG TPA: hypothetical protein GXX23_09670 [Firmicutes bacterium]|nr:hypothetical protein [Candidatus Fermentithermobacillaceae bacterium]